MRHSSRWFLGLATIAALTVDVPFAQTPSPSGTKPVATPAKAGFEVATIKPSHPASLGKGFLVRGRQVILFHYTAIDMIAYAWDVQASQVVNAPDWASKDHYDVLGVPDFEDRPNQVQLREMVQQLLATRFQLTSRRDQRELNVYALVVGRSGPKLTPSTGNPDALPRLFSGGPGVLPAKNASMADLVGVLKHGMVDRPVVDQTSIAGKYDFTLKWTPNDPPAVGPREASRLPPPPDSDTAPNLFTAIQEQLGLRLEPTKAPSDVIVIDELEKPTPD